MEENAPDAARQEFPGRQPGAGSRGAAAPRRSAARLVRRAIGNSALLRAAVKSRPVQWLIETERAARVVRPAPRFLLGQMGPRRVASYELRGSGAPVRLRHRSEDVEMLNEVFGAKSGELSYEPPAVVAGHLDADGIRIVDAGGNIGLFGIFALRRWDVAELRSFEPEPENAALLLANARASDARDRWSVEQVAVSNRAGTMRFVTGLFARGHEATDDGQGTVEVETIDLFARGGHVDLLKLDIEGGEWRILADTRMREFDARVLVMEWHERLCPGGDPHGTVLRLLDEAGYRVVADHAEHPRNGVLWAVRR